MRSRPRRITLREAAVDLLDELDRGSSGDGHGSTSASGVRVFEGGGLRLAFDDTTMRQVRTIRYQEIAEDLRGKLDAGAFAVGRLLPSEAELSTTYSASRVTIRKALEVLRSEGRVDARQGFGWFVAGETVRQPLARLGTLEEQLGRLGLSSERRIGEFAFVRAPARIREVLGVDKVLRVSRVNLADGEPFARVTVYCPEELGAQLSKAQVAESSFYDLLPVELGGAVQTIEAAAADATDAELLAIPVGSPGPALRADHVRPRGHARCSSVTTCSPGTAPPSSSTCRRSRAPSLPAGSGWWSDPPAVDVRDSILVSKASVALGCGLMAAGVLACAGDDAPSTADLIVRPRDPEGAAGVQRRRGQVRGRARPGGALR